MSSIAHEKQLQDLQFSFPDGSMHSQINSLLGSLRFLGIPVKKHWLFGASGLSFLFRIDDRIDIAPEMHELPYSRMYELVQNLGVRIGGVSGYGEGGSYVELAAAAWEQARMAIDRGCPCFGRGIQYGLNETALVYGYDKEGYFSDCWRNRGKHTPWDRIGEGLSLAEYSLQDHAEKQHKGYVDLHWMEPAPAAGDKKTVREALELAVSFAEEPERWVRPTTKTGVAALNALTAALADNKVDGWLFSWSAGMWRESFSNGAEFLQEARSRLGMDSSASFHEAIESYRLLAQRFKKLTELYPFPAAEGIIADTEQRRMAVETLQEAVPVMAASVQALAGVVEELR